MIDKDWRPEGWNPKQIMRDEAQRLEGDEGKQGFGWMLEAGASAVVIPVREATLKEVAKDLRGILKEANDLKELERLLVSYVGGMPEK